MAQNRARPRRLGPAKLISVCGALVVAATLFQGVGTHAKAEAQIAIREETYEQAQSFDTCAQPSEGGLSDWWSGTPWYAYGFYLGGSDGSYVGCTSPGVSNIDYAISLGYAIIPVWYGFQMPTSCGQSYFPSQISLDTSTAYAQGVNAASLAAALAENDYDMELPDIIYYDLESGWDTGSSSCVAAADSFVNGWDYQLSVNTPYVPGLYGSSCGSDLTSFAHISNVPSDIWAADPNDNPEIYNLECLANNLWIYNQRIHQFASTVYLSYGGYGMYVDEDCTDAEVDTNQGAAEPDNCSYIG
jgi:hypothetical protein